tara:strand:- start:1215 stop:1427 length:213 start_codon:yes stop_codon:yes gene_type:complete
MKKFICVLIFLTYQSPIFADENKGCDGILAKLKKECNIVGKSLDKMKDFSSKNKTIDQSLENIKDKLKKK